MNFRYDDISPIRCGAYIWVPNTYHDSDWNVLTYWGRDKMAAILQTIFSNAFSWVKIYEFRSIFHWNLFLLVQSTMFQHLFRKWPGDKPFSEQMMIGLSKRIYATQPQWVTWRFTCTFSYDAGNIFLIAYVFKCHKRNFLAIHLKTVNGIDRVSFQLTENTPKCVWFQRRW